MVIITGLVLWLIFGTTLVLVDRKVNEYYWKNEIGWSVLSGLLISVGTIIVFVLALAFLAPKYAEPVGTYELKTVNELVTLPKTDATIYYVAGAKINTSSNKDGVVVLAEKKKGLTAIVAPKQSVKIKEVEGAKPEITKFKKHYKKNLLTQLFSIADVEVLIAPIYEVTIPVGSQTGKTGVVIEGAED